MPIKKIDVRNGHTIFKVTNKRGVFLCYRTIPTVKLGDASAAREYPTLTEAREKASSTAKVLA